MRGEKIKDKRESMKSKTDRQAVRQTQRQRDKLTGEAAEG